MPVDATVTSIEDKFIATISSNLSSQTVMPMRPGYGSQGRKTEVFANYLTIQPPSDLTLTRYNVEVISKPSDDPDAKTDTKPPSGKKLKRIFQLLLMMPEFAGVASEWKSMIISKRPLNIPDGHEVEIKYVEDGHDEPLERAKTYLLRIVTPLSFSISDYVNYLSSTSASSQFPHGLEIIQVLNAVFGHYPQSHDGVVSVGQNRHFAIQPNTTGFHSWDLDGGLVSLRGYFQSVRPATGGLLLNVNTVHGVFYEPVRLDQLYAKLGAANKKNLSDKLKGTRISQTHLPNKKHKVTGKEIPNVKSIWGFATQGDGKGSKDEHPPQVKSYGAGPKDVKFWLSDRSSNEAAAAAQKGLPVNSYISIYDYFHISKSYFHSSLC